MVFSLFRTRPLDHPNISNGSNCFAPGVSGVRNPLREALSLKDTLTPEQQQAEEAYQSYSRTKRYWVPAGVKDVLRGCPAKVLIRST